MADQLPAGPRQITPANPDRPCPHQDFEAVVDVHPLTKTDGGPVEGYSADVRVHCAACGERFRWIGLEPGISPARPTCSLDESILTAPMRPASSDPDFGLGLPGFSIQATRPGLIPDPTGSDFFHPDPLVSEQARERLEQLVSTDPVGDLRLALANTPDSPPPDWDAAAAALEAEQLSRIDSGPTDAELLDRIEPGWEDDPFDSPDDLFIEIPDDDSDPPPDGPAEDPEQ